MQRLRLLVTGLLLGASTLLTGCFESDDPPQIKNLAVNPSKVAPAGSSISGTVEFSTDNANVAFRVLRKSSSGTTEATSDFNFTSASTLKSSPSGLGMIVPNSGVSDGSFDLAVTVVDANGNQVTEHTSFTLGDVISATNLDDNQGNNTRTLGAQGNATEGSFLDVDGFQVYKSGTKTTAEKRAIDLVFFANPNSGSGTPMLYSPKEANQEGLGNLSSWDVDLRTTYITRASGPITTEEQAAAALAGVTTQRAVAASGATYALKLENGTYASLTITSISGTGNAASVTVTILAQPF